MSQLAFSFEIEAPPAERRTPGRQGRRRALHRATGMHPQHGGVVINALVCEGLIEEVDFYFGSSHPAIEGYLGQTHNYRIAQEGKSHE